MDDNEFRDETFKVRFPTTLSIKDVVFIVGIIISGVWGFFALTERHNQTNTEVKTLSKTVDAIQRELDEIRALSAEHNKETDDRLDDIESNIKDNRGRVNEHEKYWHKGSIQ